MNEHSHIVASFRRSYSQLKITVNNIRECARAKHNIFKHSLASMASGKHR